MVQEENKGNSAAEAPNTEAANSKSEKQTFLVKERFEINFDEPLRWLDTNGALAYKVTDRIDPRRDLFALVCGNETAPRSSLLPYLKSIDHPNLMKMVEYGTITNPLRNTRTIAMIYATPQGGKIMDSLDEVNYHGNPGKFKNVILGLLSAVEALKGYNITHRAIRPDNIFFKTKEKTDIIIGDCAAAFPAYYQPAACECIESLMAVPAGRGNGSDKNDIYAIGVSCLSILLGKELLDDLTTPEVLRLKLKKGTYYTLAHDEKIPNQFTPLLKGLLADTPELRWNYIQSYNFLEGKANSFSTHINVEKSKRSLTINNEKCYTAQEVAYNLYTYPDEAYELIKSGKVLEWVKNGLENDKIGAAIEKLVKQSPEDESHDLLIAKVCILIDHNAPIHIKDISVFPDGAPKAIFYCLKKQIDISSFYDLFGTDLIRMWYLEQENLRSPSNAAEFKIYISRNDIGYGIDRIMYDFDDDLPCVSPLIGDEFVNSAPRILRALDRNYPNIKGQVLPYDKNIIAYLRCKMGKKIDGILIDLNSSKEDIQISAIIRLYTDMQNKYGPIQLVNLGKWLSGISKPVIKSYHNIKLQKAIERELLKVSKDGKLMEICKVLENAEARQKDKEQFSLVEKEIHRLLAEKNKIINSGYKLDEEAQDLAVRFASILSVLTMITSFVFNLFYWIAK